AARELNVTHAAVAQHVRALEDIFTTQLMYRRGRGMDLTEAGTTLAAALASGFGAIADGVRALHDRTEARPVRLSVTPSFGENWLMPRLGRFWTENPGVELEIQPTTRLVDLRHDDVDLAVRYGRGVWPGVQSTPLAAARFAIVGAPGLVGDLRPTTTEELKSFRWIVERFTREAEFLTRHLGFDFDEVETTVVDTNALALSAVRAGLGLSVQSRAIVDHDIAAGRLIALSDAVKDTLGYYIVTLAGRDRPERRQVIRWMLKEAG
ncbi:MAG: LysR family transcriptional regulator, partial [Pseudomonadota bacterium]